MKQLSEDDILAINTIRHIAEDGFVDGEREYHLLEWLPAESGEDHIMVVPLFVYAHSTEQRDETTVDVLHIVPLHGVMTVFIPN